MLTFLGFLEPDLTDVLRDSPTLSAQAEALIKQCMASKKVEVGVRRAQDGMSGDKEHRNIFILPPDDVRDILKLSRHFAKLCTVENASKKWWDRLNRSLLNHGFTSRALDPCAVVLIKQNNFSGEEVVKCLAEPSQVGAMSFKGRERVDTDGKSPNHDRPGALQARAARSRSLEVRQIQT